MGVPCWHDVWIAGGYAGHGNVGRAASWQARSSGAMRPRSLFSILRVVL